MSDSIPPFHPEEFISAWSLGMRVAAMDIPDEIIPGVVSPGPDASRASLFGELPSPHDDPDHPGREAFSRMVEAVMLRYEEDPERGAACALRMAGLIALLQNGPDSPLADWVSEDPSDPRFNVVREELLEVAATLPMRADHTFDPRLFREMLQERLRDGKDEGGAGDDGDDTE